MGFVNTLRLRQNGHCFADDTFKCIFLIENVIISIKISLKFVPKVQISNIPALVQIMAWCWPGANPLSRPMMVYLSDTYMHHSDSWVSTLSMRQNRCHFADTILKFIFLCENCILNQISLKFPTVQLTISHHYTCRTTKLLGGGGGGILVSLRPSIRPSVLPSVRPTSCVRSVAPTVLVGSISYLHILSSNFRRCVTCKISCKILKFEFLVNF